MDSDRQFLDRFNRHFTEIDIELEKSISSDVPLLREIGKHSLLGQGKRLRPLLFVLSALMCGCERRDMYQLSIIFEYIHCASLLHDDVIDNAETRRRKPSASSVWGNTAAVLTGDYMFSIAFNIALEKKAYGILEILNDTAVHMTEGQMLELACTGKWETGEKEYMKIITSKTADLISASCASGSVIAESNGSACEDLKNFGLNMGIAFQMIDDLLDYSSSEETFGKPVGKDVREGKITLPLIYSIQDMNSSEAVMYRDTFVNGSEKEDDYEELIRYVKKSGAIKKTREKAAEYVEKASGYLDRFPGTLYRSDLLDLNEYIAGRLY